MSPVASLQSSGQVLQEALAIGDRVMVHHYRGCGVCEICAMGYEQLCPQGRVTYGGGTGHGANADYILVPSRTLVHLHDELSFAAGAAISCGTGTAWNGLKKMSVSGRDSVAVFGQGPVGLSGTLSAKCMGASVIAIDVVPERLSLARELGADHVINSREVDPVAAIRDVTGGAGASAVLETSGNPHARHRPADAFAPLAAAATWVWVVPPPSISTGMSFLRWPPSMARGPLASRSSWRLLGSWSTQRCLWRN